MNAQLRDQLTKWATHFDGPPELSALLHKAAAALAAPKEAGDELTDDPSEQRPARAWMESTAVKLGMHSAAREPTLTLARALSDWIDAHLAAPSKEAGAAWPRFVQDECVEVLRNVDTQFRATGQASARIERLINLIAGMKPVDQRQEGDGWLELPASVRRESTDAEKLAALPQAASPPEGAAGVARVTGRSDDYLQGWNDCIAATERAEENLAALAGVPAVDGEAVDRFTPEIVPDCGKGPYVHLHDDPKGGWVRYVDHKRIIAKLTHPAGRDAKDGP